jgi:hypothetical protein
MSHIIARTNQPVWPNKSWMLGICNTWHCLNSLRIKNLMSFTLRRKAWRESYFCLCMDVATRNKEKKTQREKNKWTKKIGWIPRNYAVTKPIDVLLVFSLCIHGCKVYVETFGKKEGVYLAWSCVIDKMF